MGKNVDYHQVTDEYARYIGASSTSEDSSDYESWANSYSDEISNAPTDIDDGLVPAPVVWRVCKESMKYNMEANRLILCPRHGSTAITDKLLETLNMKDCEYVYEGEIEWMGNMIILNAMPITQNAVEFSMLRDCLSDVLESMISELNPALPYHIAIPYFLAIDEEGNHVTWEETMNYIVTYLEEQVNIYRLTEKTITQVDITFYENW